MNWKYLPAFAIAILLIVVFVFATRKAEDKNFQDAKEVIIIRKIGHEILLQSGDSTSGSCPLSSCQTMNTSCSLRAGFLFSLIQW